MKLPRNDRVVIDVEKVRGYLLNPHHPRGRHKARVFRAALGLDAADAMVLIDWLRGIAAAIDADRLSSDQFGVRYSIQAVMTTAAGQARVQSVWIVPPGNDPPRLVTAYVVG